MSRKNETSNASVRCLCIIDHILSYEQASMQLKLCGFRQKGLCLPPVDYIGINCVSTSKRFVALEDIDALLWSIPEESLCIAVIQNPNDELLSEIMKKGFDGVQFHGEETPERILSFCKQRKHELGKRPYVIKALPFSQWQEYKLYDVDLFVFDAHTPWQWIWYDYSILSEIPSHVPFLVAWWVNLDTIWIIQKQVPLCLWVDIASWVEVDWEWDRKTIEQIYALTA